MRSFSSSILDSVKSLPADWHANGTVTNRALDAIARHTRGTPLTNTMETGTGRTTLLLSHLSGSHTVFALGSNDSMLKVRDSELLRKESVAFVEGPSQQNVPIFDFPRLQLALLDGPHAYPFPELEYFYVYPHLDPGALLIIDDVNIPTVANMFHILREDEMFEPLEVVDQTAFLRRTRSATLDPFGDGWWAQGYNERRARSPSEPIRARLYKWAPQPLRCLYSSAKQRFLR